jgi:hypothetical protein
MRIMTDDIPGLGPHSPSQIRPYLAGHGDDQQQPPNDPDVSPLRPYLLTSGRAEPVDDTLEIEAQILTSELGIASHERLSFEHRDIVTLCTATMSVAEVAAKLRLHIGVARVLVADLAAAGYLTVWRPGAGLSDDLDMIERVIRGLQEIR